MCFKHSNIQTFTFYHKLLPKGADGIEDSVDADQKQCVNKRS